MKNTKHLNSKNVHIKDNLSNIHDLSLHKDKNERPSGNSKASLNNRNNLNNITANNIHSLNSDMKNNSQEKENKSTQANNYLEVPIEINLDYFEQNADKNISLHLNKENFNSSNLNDNYVEQSISSFISKLASFNIFKFRN